jgi:MFS family permease
MTVTRPNLRWHPTARAGGGGPGPHYKWVALSNTTLGTLMATVNASVTLIALPDIFRGIGLDPLLPGNTSLLLWLILGYLLVTAVLVVTFGRLGDMFGRVRIYNLGFAVFSVFSILLAVTWMHGTTAALWLIAMRILQAVGGAMLFANSAAILTDAFPATQRGLALGLNQVAAIAGQFMGLVVGGLLGPVQWRLVFVVSVPFGVAGTLWAYSSLRELSQRRPVHLDWWGNLTFAVGLVALLAAITYGIQPYGGHTMGWTNPWVMAGIAGGVGALALFCIIESRAPHPMFNLGLFRIRAFSAGNLASLLAALGRGGLMFVLIIWLQGIYLPQHGYSFSATPLWAGVAMLPLTVGFLVAGPLSGWLSDRFGARSFATGGMALNAVAFLLLELLPVNFVYWQFALILLLSAAGQGLFASPNRAAIMNSLPVERRGAGSGMAATFQNSATVLSIGIFFSLIVLGLASSLPSALSHGLAAHGLSAASAAKVASLPPVSVLFASLLGYNPIKTLLGPALAHLPAAQAAYLTGRGFFPSLVSPAFSHGLSTAFNFAIAACLVAGIASLFRGQRYVHDDQAPALDLSERGNDGHVLHGDRDHGPAWASAAPVQPVGASGGNVLHSNLLGGGGRFEPSSHRGEAGEVVPRPYRGRTPSRRAQDVGPGGGGSGGQRGPRDRRGRVFHLAGSLGLRQGDMTSADRRV